jgi:hypothetical protein
MAKKVKTKVVKATQTIKPALGSGCPKGQIWSPSLGKCVDDVG